MSNENLTEEMMTPSDVTQYVVQNTDYSNMSDEELDNILQAKAVGGVNESDLGVDTEWRFSEFNSALAGGMAGGTIGMMLGGPPGALLGGALGGEGGRRFALAGNEFIEWMEGDGDLGVGPIDKMVEEAVVSANMIFADMALSGLGSKVGKGWQKFKELFKGNYDDITKLSPVQLKNIMDKINIRGNPTLFGGPGSKRLSVALTNLPPSARIMQESINNTYDDIIKVSDDITNNIYRGAKSKVTSGASLKKGLDSWSQQVKQNIDNIYENVNLKGYVDLPLTKKALAKMKPTDLEKSSGSVFPKELQKYYSDIVNEKVIGKRPAVVGLEKRKEFVTLPPKEVPRKTKVNISTEQYVDETGEVFGEYIDADLAKRRGIIERPSGDNMKFSPKKREITLIDEVLEERPPAEIDVDELSVFVPEDPGIVKKPSGKLTWRDAKNMRSAIGSKLSAPPLLRMGDKPTGQYASIYAALTQDLDNFAMKHGAANQIKRARQYVAAFHKRKALVDMLADSDTAEAAFNSAMIGAKDGPTRINALRKSIRAVKGDTGGITLSDSKTLNGDEIWDEFVATNFWKFGRKPPGQQRSVDAADFGINTFLKNYSSMKQSGSLDALFNTPKLKKIKPRLNEFVKVMQEVKGLDELINFSKTAEQTAAMKALTGGFGAASGYAVAGPVGIVLGPLVSMGSPYAISKWLTSPKGLKFLTTAVKEAQKIPNSSKQQFVRYFGRVMTKKLTDIVKDDPSMEEPVKAYLMNMEKINAAQGY